MHPLSGSETYSLIHFQSPTQSDLLSRDGLIPGSNKILGYGKLDE